MDNDNVKEPFVYKSETVTRKLMINLYKAVNNIQSYFQS